MPAPFNLDRATFLQEVLQPARLTRIADVGANPIDPAPYANLLQAGLCEVWGFEPQQEAYDALVADAPPGAHYLPHAIGPRGTATLNLCRNTGFSSLLEPNTDTFDAVGRMHRGGTVVDRVAVKLTPLDGVKELPQFDLLKIDVQGGETAVFNTGKKRIKAAVAVITEVAAIPIYVDQPLMHTQMAALEKLGYHFHKFLFLKPIQFANPFSTRLPRRAYRHQALDGDAVFLRGLLDLPGLSDEEIKHLIVLTDAVILSQDVTIAALTELLRRSLVTGDDIHAYVDRLPDASPREET
jgi:FkbM family methyltransferase